MENLKEITRVPNTTKKLTKIIEYKNIYIGFTEEQDDIGFTSKTEEAITAFETKNWEYFSDAFDLVN